MDKVLITGFGPFEGHTVNASWETVQELERKGIADCIELHTREVSVCYKDVKEEIPILETELRPNLIVHVGVSGVTECVQIEEFAHSTGYVRADIHGCSLDETSIAPECLKTSLDISKLRMYCDRHHCRCEIMPSQDAGRYLCEYIYYTSLKANIAPVLFVHVPCLDKPYDKEKLAEALKLIVLGALKQCAS